MTGFGSTQNPADFLAWLKTPAANQALFGIFPDRWSAQGVVPAGQYLDQRSVGAWTAIAAELNLPLDQAMSLSRDDLERIYGGAAHVWNRSGLTNGHVLPVEEAPISDVPVTLASASPPAPHAAPTGLLLAGAAILLFFLFRRR